MGWLLTQPEIWFALIGYVLLIGLSWIGVRWLLKRHVLLGAAAIAVLAALALAYAFALPVVQEIYVSGRYPEEDEWAVQVVRAVNMARNFAPGLVFMILIWRGIDALSEKSRVP